MSAHDERVQEIESLFKRLFSPVSETKKESLSALLGVIESDYEEIYDSWFAHELSQSMFKEKDHHYKQEYQKLINIMESKRLERGQKIQGKIRRRLKALSSPKTRIKESAIDSMTRLIGKEDVENYEPELVKRLTRIVFNEKNENYQKKMFQLINLIEGKRLRSIIINPNKKTCLPITHDIEDIFETLRTSTDPEVRGNAISTITRLIKSEAVEILDPRFNHFLSQATLEEKDEQVREKLETLLKRSENRGARYSTTDSDKTHPENETDDDDDDDDDDDGVIKLPYLKNLTIKKLLPLAGVIVLAFAIYLGFRPKVSEDIEKAFGQVNTAETGKISKPPERSEKEKYITIPKDAKSPFLYPDRTIPLRVTIINPMIKSDLEPYNNEKLQRKSGTNDYFVKPHPYAGLTVRTRTEILKKTFLNNKLKQKIKTVVYEAEEVIKLSQNHFETRIATIRKSQNLKDLHVYKFLEPGEIAYATYTKRGIIKEYRAHSRSKHLWYPESYLNFVYPRTRVKMNQKWNGPFGERSALLQYRITDLLPFQGSTALSVELESGPNYMTQVNEDPSKKVPARLYGFYYLDVKTGKIRHFSLLKEYRYTLSKPEGKFEIWLTYRTETY